MHSNVLALNYFATAETWISECVFAVCCVICYTYHKYFQNKKIFSEVEGLANYCWLNIKQCS